MNIINYIEIEVYLIISITIILICGVYLENLKIKSKDFINNKIRFLSILSLIFIFILLIIKSYNIEDKIYILNSLEENSFSMFIKFFLLISFLLLLGLNNKNFIEFYEYYIILLIALLGMLIMISSQDFIVLFLSLEIISLSGYILASLKKDSEQCIEAALKYFILGSLGTSILIFGVALLYGYLGTTNYYIIKLLLITNNNEYFYIINNEINYNYLLGILFISIGFLLKVGAAPYHMWLPDVYEGSIMIITSYFAIIPKIALLTGFIQIYLIWLVTGNTGLESVFILSSLLSMVIGSLGALNQLKIKRLIAYSSISHIGYMLMGLCTGTILGVKMLLFYLIIYIIMNIVFFSIILSLTSNNNEELKYIKDLKGLADKNSFMALALTITLLSMAGIPPFAGFLSKYLMFNSIIESKMWLLLILGIITSVVSTFYYLSIIKTMYFEKASLNVININLYGIRPYIISYGVIFLVLYIFNGDILISLIGNSL